MITEIFGENCKRAKVFDLLLSHPYSEYTRTDIKEITGIAMDTLNSFISQLVEYGIIKPTRRYGNGQLYQINMGSPITQALNSFQNQLADIEFEKDMKEYQKNINPNIKPIKPFEEIVKKEIEKEYDAFEGYLNSFIEKANEPIQQIGAETYEPVEYILAEASSSATSAILSGDLGTTQSIFDFN